MFNNYKHTPQSDTWLFLYFKYKYLCKRVHERIFRVAVKKFTHGAEGPLRACIIKWMTLHLPIEMPAIALDRTLINEHMRENRIASIMVHGLILDCHYSTAAKVKRKLIASRALPLQHVTKYRLPLPKWFLLETLAWLAAAKGKQPQWCRTALVTCSGTSARTYCTTPPSCHPHSAFSRMISVFSAAPCARTLGREQSLLCSQCERRRHNFHTWKKI